MAGFHHMMLSAVSSAAPAITKVIAFFGVSSTATTPPAYEWIPDSGYGTKLANGPTSFVQVSNDGTEISKDGTMMAYATSASPYIVVIRVSKDGYGTAFSNPASLPAGTGRSIGFGPNNDVVTVGHQTSPYISTYPISYATGFGTKYANPGTAVPSTPYGSRFTSKGNELGIAGSVTPRWNVYAWSNATGYGTRYSNSYSELSIAAQGGYWNSTGTKYISGGSQAGNYGPMYFDHVEGGGFTSMVFPGTQVPGTIYGTRFNKSNNALVTGHSTTPFISAYQWDNTTGFGTKYANPATLATNYTIGSSFTPSETDVVSGVVQNPNNVTAWKWSNANGFGTKYANPATAPGTYVRGCEVYGYY